MSLTKSHCCSPSTQSLLRRARIVRAAPSNVFNHLPCCFSASQQHNLSSFIFVSLFPSDVFLHGCGVKSNNGLKARAVCGVPTGGPRRSGRSHVRSGSSRVSLRVTWDLATRGPVCQRGICSGAPGSSRSAGRPPRGGRFSSGRVKDHGRPLPVSGSWRARRSMSAARMD